LVKTITTLKTRGVLPLGTEVWCNRTSVRRGFFALLGQLTWVQLFDAGDHSRDRAGCLIVTDDEVRWGHGVKDARRKASTLVLDRTVPELRTSPILVAVDHPGKDSLTVVTHEYGKENGEGVKEGASTYQFTAGVCQVSNLVTVIDLPALTASMRFPAPTAWDRSTAFSVGSSFLVNGLDAGPADWVRPEHPESWSVIADDAMFDATAEVLGIFDHTDRELGSGLARRALLHARPLWHGLPQHETYGGLVRALEWDDNLSIANRTGCAPEAVEEAARVWRDCVLVSGLTASQVSDLRLSDFTCIESEAEAALVANQLGLPTSAVIEVHKRLVDYSRQRALAGVG
jgi:hypothetical protein